MKMQHMSQFNFCHGGEADAFISELEAHLDWELSRLVTIMFCENTLAS